MERRNGQAAIPRILCAGGRFDDEGGRPSGYFAKFSAAFLEAFAPEAKEAATVANGGSFADLAALAERAEGVDAILWAADVPNDKPKLVRGLKAANPKAMLAITKNNRSGKYDRRLLAARALQSKANLLVEFGSDDDGRVVGSLWDPLGNRFAFREPDVARLAGILAARLRLLASATRVASVSVADEAPAPPEAGPFLATARLHAERFHELIHGPGNATDGARMMGNLSFRCENGFPSVRGAGTMWVSRRDVDKRGIGPEALVPVSLAEGGSDPCRYAGPNKPSVDSPIQRELYRALPKARFMLHAHVFVRGAPCTENVLPCGALEEAGEILAALGSGYDGSVRAAVNLRGHGSLVVAAEAADFESIDYVATLEEAGLPAGT